MIAVSLSTDPASPFYQNPNGVAYVAVSLFALSLVFFSIGNKLMQRPAWMPPHSGEAGAIELQPIEPKADGPPIDPNMEQSRPRGTLVYNSSSCDLAGPEEPNRTPEPRPPLLYNSSWCDLSPPDGANGPAPLEQPQQGQHLVEQQGQHEEDGPSSEDRPLLQAEASGRAEEQQQDADLTAGHEIKPTNSGKDQEVARPDADSAATTVAVAADAGAPPPDQQQRQQSSDVPMPSFFDLVKGVRAKVRFRFGGWFCVALS